MIHHTGHKRDKKDKNDDMTYAVSLGRGRDRSSGVAVSRSLVCAFEVKIAKACKTVLVQLRVSSWTKHVRRRLCFRR